jgi:hypothetical protein
MEMKDYQTFKVKSISENKKSLFECKDSKSDSGHSLLVHVAATHSGIVNGNLRFYRPDRMQEGCHTWLPQAAKDGTVLRTPRPVLMGHDEKGDVLGRVLEAKYVDNSWKYAADYPMIKDFLFYQRDGKKKHNLFDTVDWITDNLMPLNDYAGLGYIDLGLRITNPNAIRKVLDDEYMTVSVGFKTDSAICSICHADWAKVGDKCDHKLGQVVDGKQAFLISGAIDNQELSFINFAADPFATTLSKKVLTDKLEAMFFLGLGTDTRDSLLSAGLTMKDGLYEADLLVVEETMPQVIDATEPGLSALGAEIKSADLTQKRALELKDMIGAWAPETDALQNTQRTLFSTVNAKISKHGWNTIPETDPQILAELDELMDAAKKCPDCGKPMADCTCNKDEEDATTGKKTKKIKKPKTDPSEELNDQMNADGCFAWPEDSIPQEDREFFSDVEGINQELEDEIDAAITAGELPAEMKDSKLSAEAREKLEDKSFCGPNKTFPVVDCAHVIAAKRLVGRSKLSDSSKEKILASVSHKAKDLSCDSVIKKDSISLAVDDKFINKVNGILTKLTETDEVKRAPITEEERISLASTLVSLDKAYDKLAGSQSSASYQLRWAIRAMLTDWDADDEVRWALHALKNSSDHVVMTKIESDERDTTINTLTTSKDTLAGRVKGLEDARQAILNASKKTLAQQIVMYNVLSGQEAYKNLSQDKLDEKIVELSKRAITSLKDTVQDILTGLHWVKTEDSVPAAEQKDREVNDNERITDDTGQKPSTEVTDSEARLEAEKALDDLNARLRYLSPLERGRFLAVKNFVGNATAATK